MMLEMNGEQVPIPKLYGSLLALTGLAHTHRHNKGTLCGVPRHQLSSDSRFIFTPRSLNEPLMEICNMKDIRSHRAPSIYRVEQQENGLFTQLTRCLIGT